jgi:hypothetical protein
MKNHPTNLDVQRVAFVESLHASLQKQTQETVREHERLISLASSYVNDGLSESESIELLMIDGLGREAAENYVSLAACESSMDEEENSLPEYIFQFEDESGKIWSSYDINKTIRAASKEEALEKISEIEDPDLEIYPSKVISIDRIN